MLMMCVSVNSFSQKTAVDLRVLIDVSGSMKKNDPKNLRAPALRLLVGLLPDDSKAGVWSFGEYVEELVPLAKVNKSWKKKGAIASNKIRSAEMFTDIEQALMVATADWKESAPETRRNIILLTDGLLDVDKDEFLNNASRKRVVEEMLPELRDLEVKVHTIALSEKADHELLKMLAVATDGGYEFADTAEKLNRVFVRLFEKTAPADALPLMDNEFTVDSSIEDMTLLVFRNTGSKATGITKPDGSSFTAKELPDNVTWKSDEGYDLVTVDSPVVGDWKLNAAIDPDNRVMIVTNLKLRIPEIPNNLLREDSLQVSAWLTEGDKPVEKPDFLRLVDFSVQSIMNGVDDGTQRMLDNGKDADKKTADGIFSYDIGDLQNAGSQMLIFRARGGSFEREIRHTIEVHESPVSVEVIPPVDNGTPYMVSVIAKPELVKMDTVLTRITISDAPDLSGKIPQTEETGVWKMPIEQNSENRTVNIKAEGRLMNGRLFKVQIEKLIPALVIVKPEILPPVDEVKEKSQEVVDTVEEAPPEEEINWVNIGIIAGITNLILIPLLIFGYIFMKKRRNKILQAEEDALGF